MLHTLIEWILIELILKAGACSSSRIGVKAELRVVKLALKIGLESMSEPEPVVNTLRLPKSLVAIVK